MDAALAAVLGADPATGLAVDSATGFIGFSVLTGDVPYKARTGIRSYAATISSIASCHAGVPARMSPLTKTPSGSPAPVGDHAAGLTDQQRSRRDVPDPEPELEEPIEDPGADVGEVEARGTRPAEVLETGKATSITGGSGQPLLAAERKAGGDDAGPLDGSTPRAGAALVGRYPDRQPRSTARPGAGR